MGTNNEFKGIEFPEREYAVYHSSLGIRRHDELFQPHTHTQVHISLKYVKTMTTPSHPLSVVLSLCKLDALTGQFSEQCD